MERHSVRAHVVDTLNDVDFALVGPAVQTGLPDRRPGTTALWHVPNIKAVGDGMMDQQSIR